MSNKRNMGPENNNQPKMPKFNMNWIYIAILSALLLVFVAPAKRQGVGFL